MEEKNAEEKRVVDHVEFPVDIYGVRSRRVVYQDEVIPASVPSAVAGVEPDTLRRELELGTPRPPKLSPAKKFLALLSRKKK